MEVLSSNLNQNKLSDLLEMKDRQLEINLDLIKIDEIEGFS